MITVRFSAGMAQYTGGLEEVAIEAPRVHELMEKLVERFPGLADQLERMAVAIGDEIYHNAAYQKLEPGSVIYLLPPIAGG